MKLTKVALLLAMGALLPGVQSSAQQRASRESFSPRSASRGGSQQVKYDYDSYYAEGEESPEPATESPSDEPPVTSGETSALADTEFAGCDNCNGGGCKSCCQDACEDEGPFKLFDSCLLDRMGLKIGGWMAQSYTWNPYRPRDRFNGPLTWIDRSNEYSMNELYSYMDRPTDTEGSGWDMGGRVDALYGQSFRWTTSAGLEDKINGNTPHLYGLALPQIYGEVAYNDFKFKVGHFISPVGFYTVGTYNNFFNFIPYTYQYGEPFTHTGMMGSYKISDTLTGSAGIIRGWDNWDNFNPHLSYLGTLTYTDPDNGSSLAMVNIIGKEPNQNGAFTSRYFQTLVYSRPITECLTHVLQSDFGVQGNALANGKTARWYGLNSYLYRKLNDKWSIGLNSEWFRDEEGFRVGGVTPSPFGPGAHGLSLARSGYSGSFYRMAFGPRWQPHSNVIMRTAFIWDRYDGKVNNAGGLRPFDDGQRRHQEVLGTDMIITF